MQCFYTPQTLTPAQQLQANQNIASLFNGYTAVGASTLNASHVGKIVYDNAPNQTTTLPAASAFPSQCFAFGHQQTGTLTIAPTGADKFFGPAGWNAATLSLSTLGDSGVVMSDGGNWHVVGGSPSVLGGGVTSIAGNTGAFTLGAGLTNTANNLKVNAGHVPGQNGTVTPVAGEVGEQISSVVLYPSRITISSTVNATLATINLTAGNWLLFGFANFETTGSPAVSYIATILSPTIGGDNRQTYGPAPTATSTDGTSYLPPTSCKISAPQAFSLTVNSAWVGGTSPTMKVWGEIVALRIT